MKLHCDEVTGNVVRVRADGRIAPSADEQLNDPLVAILGAQVFSQNVELDLSDADFISSSGIGWLLHLHKQFEHNRGKLTLHRISPAVDQVLRMMRLESVLHMAEATA